MPNRILKETICTSDNINDLSPEAEVFFYRLITVCDDFGRMDARAQILRARCFPLKVDIISTDDIEKWLNSLVDSELIVLYRLKEKIYLQMITWDKHQQKRAKNSKYPSIDDDDVVLISSDIKCNQTTSNVPENRESRIENRESNAEHVPLEKPEPPTPKKPKPENIKIKFEEFVLLTEEEHQKLIEKYGAADTRRLIELLDNYKGQSGKKYKSDYRAILNWVVDRLNEEKKKLPANQRAPNNAEKYEIFIPPVRN